MSASPNIEKIHQQIGELQPEQLILLSEFLDFLTYQTSHPQPTLDSDDPTTLPTIGANLDPYLKKSLPDCYWLGDPD